MYIYNSLTQQKELFNPIDSNLVRLYACGPTVYDDAHIGNIRAVVAVDLLFRLLRYKYGEQNVIYVRNITDVDDKINAAAASKYPDLAINEAIKILTHDTADRFIAATKDLFCLEPTHQPRATEHIAKMHELIERLIELGYAYVAEDHVLFSVQQMNDKATIAYGGLSKRSLEEMLPGARVEVATYKHNPMDFVLWKPSQQHEPSWPSPAGITRPGRPGWHIECSAMSLAKLIEPYGGGLDCADDSKNCFDIHAGGLDLIFPHHENEIAQSCCALGTHVMANYWVHNGFLQIEGKKMSKSLGNFITITEILEADMEQYSANLTLTDKRKWAGLTARFSLLQTHYRDSLNWTQKRLSQSAIELYSWYSFLRQVPTAELVISEDILAEVADLLSDDLNMSPLIAKLRVWYRAKNANALFTALDFIGLLYLPFIKEEAHPLFNKPLELTESEIESLLEKRAQLIATKDWGGADAIRAQLLEKNIVLQDIKNLETGARETIWKKKV